MLLRTRLLFGLSIAITCSAVFAQNNEDGLTLETATPELNSIVESDDASETGRDSPELPAGEQIRQRFPNGKVHIERWVVESKAGNFVNNGRYVEYNTQGDRVVAGQYVMGRRDGAWTRLVAAESARRLVPSLDSGFAAPFASKATFDQDRLNGDWTCSDTKGNLVFVWGFEDGMRHGQSTWFNSKGAVIQSVTYEKNLAHGPAKLAGKSSTALQDIQFENGRYQRKTDNWFPASRGKKRHLQTQDAHLAPGRFNVASQDWDRSGVKYRTYSDTDVIRHGRTITFFPNGQRESDAHYDHGKKMGSFAWWYPNGQQKTVGEYQDDKEQGRWNWWHENGMKQASGDFASGVRIEQWSAWASDGKLASRVNADDTRVARRKVRRK